MNKMKTKLIILLSVLTMTLGLTGRTQQTMTREFGGDMTIELEPGEKLEEITWKDEDSLWYLTRPMREDEEPETHVFKESSAWGILEGTVTIIEKE